MFSITTDIALEVGAHVASVILVALCVKILMVVVPNCTISASNFTVNNDNAVCASYLDS